MDRTRAASISSCESTRHTARWRKMKWWSMQASNNTTLLQVTRGESPGIRAGVDLEQLAPAPITATTMHTTSHLRLELLEEAWWWINRPILRSRRIQVAQARSLSSINSHSSLSTHTNRLPRGAHSETTEGCVTSRRPLRFLDQPYRPVVVKFLHLASN